MKIFILFIPLFFFTCDSIGEGYSWQGESNGFSRHYGSIGYDYGWNAAYSPFDEGIVIVGQRSHGINSQSDMWAIKTDKRGMVEWEKGFGGSKNEAGYDVISTTNGGFLFVGYSWSFGNEQDIYAIKTDFHGNIEWEKTFGGIMWEVGNAVIEVKGGGFIIAGFSNSPGISSGNSDIFLIKINISGDLIWQKAYGNQAFPNHEWGHDIIQDNNGDLLVVGARDRYSKGSLNGLVYKLDQNGNLIWEKEIIGDGQISESIYSISKSATGSYFLCSTLNSSGSVDIYQPKISKMDGLGNIDWERTLATNSREYHQFRATTNELDEVIIAGSSSKRIAGFYKEDAFMAKIDGFGNIIWSYPYGSGDEDDWGWSVFTTPKNNIVLVGSTKSFGASLFDIYLVGTNSEGIYE